MVRQKNYLAGWARPLKKPNRFSAKILTKIFTKINDFMKNFRTAMRKMMQKSEINSPNFFNIRLNENGLLRLSNEGKPLSKRSNLYSSANQK